MNARLLSKHRDLRTAHPLRTILLLSLFACLVTVSHPVVASSAASVGVTSEPSRDLFVRDQAPSVARPLALRSPHDVAKAFGPTSKEALEVHCDVLEPGAALRGCDLSFRSLEGIDLRGADLRSARLSGANLRGAALQGARLDGADLSFADLRGANLRFASMRHVDLRVADLSDAIITDSDLRDADLSSARLTVEDPGALDAPRLAGELSARTKESAKQRHLVSSVSLAP